MVADDPRTRNALQAVAFGRAVTPEDQVAAARALQALRELDERASAARVRAAGIPVVPAPGTGGARRTAATGAGAASGPVTVEVVDDSQAFRDGAWRDSWSATPNRVTETLRRFWVVPVIVASIAVGAVGGSVATRAAEKAPVSLAPAAQAIKPAYTGSYSEPNDADVADPVVPDPPSDAAALAGADALLSLPRLASDTFPDEATLKALGINPGSTHFLTTNETIRLWAARGFDRSLCLVILTTADGRSARSGCTPESQFPQEGVSVDAADGAYARWTASGTIETSG
jgi:hypothetical protein